MKILVAEDNEMTAEILRIHLRKHGFTAIIASTGAEALECLTSTPDISLVITDLMMPGMDGLELVSEMRRRLEWRDIPVVVASARAEPEAVTKAAELGCRQFLVKPIHDASLVRAIRAALSEQRSLLRPQPEILEQLGIDAQTYKRLVERFAVLAQAAIASLEESLADRRQSETKPDQAELTRLLEAANLLGADRLADAAAALTKPDTQRNGEDDEAQRRLLLRELTLLLSTLGLRKARIHTPRVQQPETDASKEPKTGEASRGGRSLEIKRQIVRVS